MSNNFTRIEGTVSDSVKDWIDLESMKTATPVKIIVGNAVSLYKSQNEGTHLGERIELMDICERKCKKNLQNLRYNLANFGKIEPKIAQYTISLMKLLDFLIKKTPQKSRDSIKSLYRGAIADHLDALDGIKATDKEVYDYCIDIMDKSLNKDYKDYFYELSKSSRGLEGTTYNNIGAIKYIGGTLENDTFESQIIDLINNCMTVPAGYMREAKIQDSINFITSQYPADKVHQLQVAFETGINRMED